MRIRWAALAFLLVASPPLPAQTVPSAAQQGKASVTPRQSLAEWQHKHDLALQYKNLSDFYAAMKKEAASKPRAPAGLDGDMDCG